MSKIPFIHTSLKLQTLPQPIFHQLRSMPQDTIYPLETPPTLHPFFQDAWHGVGDFKDPYVEEAENGLYRIYLHPALRGSTVSPWIMIESPPQ